MKMKYKTKLKNNLEKSMHYFFDNPDYILYEYILKYIALLLIQFNTFRLSVCILAYTTNFMMCNSFAAEIFITSSFCYNQMYRMKKHSGHLAALKVTKRARKLRNKKTIDKKKLSDLKTRLGEFLTGSSLRIVEAQLN